MARGGAASDLSSQLAELVEASVEGGLDPSQPARALAPAAEGEPQRGHLALQLLHAVPVGRYLGSVVAGERAEGGGGGALLTPFYAFAG